MNHSEQLELCLEDLEARLDPEQERRHLDAWKQFLDGNLTEDTFSPPAREPVPPRVEWPQVHVNDALDDIDLMLLREYGQVSSALASGSSATLNVRANYGVVIMSSQYGCEVVVMDRKMNTLPTVCPLGSRDAVRVAADGGVPEVFSGVGGKVFEVADRFVDIQSRYPKIGKWVDVYHPDLQGPIDNIELVWGSDMFLGFYEEPQLMRDMLSVMTDHYLAFMKAWYERIPQPSPYAAHWGMRFKGWPMLRNDSLMNLSPEMYIEFIRDHDQRVLRELGGMGAVHYCGRGEHFIEPMSEMKGLTAVHLSQPELNDMETIFRHTVDKGIKLIGLRRDAVDAAGRDLCGQVQS